MTRDYDPGWNYLPPDSDKATNAIIVDIDGTLANMGTRDPYDFSLVSNDTPLTSVINFSNAMRKSGVRVLLVTGRSDVSVQDTKDWLSRYGVEYDDLRMRREGSYEPSWVFKSKVLKQIERDGSFNVLFAIDDRDSVLNMWNNVGLDAMRVMIDDFGGAWLRWLSA